MLSGTRLLELEGPFGAACARFLGSLGAQVVKLVRTRDPVDRDIDGSSVRDRPQPGQLFDDAGKRCVPLDLEQAEGVATLKDLVASADFLLESAPPGWLAARGLDHETLALLNPRLIHASITAFGSSGPYAGYRGGELVASAMSGVLRTVGYEDRPPVQEALDACGFHAAAAAAAGIAIAHFERVHTGRGQHVDVSVQEVGASRNTSGVLLWQFDRRKLQRSGDALRYGRARVRCVWPLADGYAFHSLMSGRFGAPANAALSRWIDEHGLDNPLRDVDWMQYDRSALPAPTRAIWEAAIARFFRSRTKAEIAGEGRRRGINATVAQAPHEILGDPQLLARGFFQQAALATAPRIQLPAYFLRSTSSERGSTALGSERMQAHEQRRARLLREAAAAGEGGASDSVACLSALAGVKVLDFSWALVGSLTTKALADHGACVVKLESAGRPCLTRSDVQVAVSTRESLDDKPWYAHLNTGKLSLRLNIKHPRARDVLDPLLDWADVVIENFSPGTLKKLGLDYATLAQRRPDLIMLSASAYGQTGPLAHEWGVDGTAAALSGRLALTGWPDRPPVTPGAVPYADALVPQFLVAAAVSALARLRSTGAGCYIDASMYELSVQQMTEALVQAQLGRPLLRAGNRTRAALLQGVYPARGEDRWIAISVFDADDWARLTAWTGGTWPEAAALLSADEAMLDALDHRLAEVTARHEDFELMRALQARGIAAGVVQDAEDLLERDPQLRARPAFVAVEHPLLGRFEHQSCPYHLSRTPASLSAAPLLGQHTEMICHEILQLSDETFAQLELEKLFF